MMDCTDMLRLLTRERDLTAAVLQTVASLVVVLDRDARVVRFNQACEQATGYRSEELLGRTLWERLIPGEELQHVQRVFNSLASGDFPNRFRNYWMTRSGERRLIDWTNTALLDEHGRVEYVIGTGIDITDQAQTEAARRESEERFRATFEQAAVGIAHVGLDGRWLRINRRLCEIVGYSHEQLQSRTFQDITHPEDLGRDLELARRLLAGEIEHYSMEKRYIRSDRTPVWVNLTGSLVRDPDGNPAYFIAVVEDITARKRVEDELRRAKLAAEAASKAKDRFLATLSHELRTPLTPVLATVSMLETDQRLDDELRRDMQVIRRNVELEARLIDDLLDLTRITRGKLELRREESDVHALLAHARNTCCQSQIFGKQLRVQTDTDAAAHRVWADPARLEQVFWNLISNAVKFTPEGGQIQIRTSNPQPGWIRIEIMDSGVGIDPASLERIFDAFEQGERRVTREYGGLGLGLAICRALVSLHGGSIRAHSEGTGKGATFTVDLPLLSRPKTSPSPGTQDASSPARRNGSRPALRILLVEDHADTARVMQHLLRLEGDDVALAGDVESALALARGQTFDLVISDLGLPDGNGLDLVRQLRQSSPQLRAIALSGYGMDDDVQRSREAGFDQHLTKPVDLARLHGVVAEVMASRPGRGDDPPTRR